MARKRETFIIDGKKLQAVMAKCQVTDEQLASATNLTKTTIANYQKAQHKADKRDAQKVCESLKITLEDICLEEKNSQDGKVKSETVGWIAGRWKAVCFDQEIPPWLTYNKASSDDTQRVMIDGHPVDWLAELEIQQTRGESHFTVSGVDDVRFGGDKFEGHGTIELAKWICLTYRLTDPRFPQFGVVYAEFKNDRRTIEGVLVGHEREHRSSTQFVLSRIVLKLVQPAKG